MNAQESLTNNIKDLANLLRPKPESNLPLKDFEPTYKQLRGIKGYWECGWDEIMVSLEHPEWIKVAREDEVFKEYYKLRVEIDRLEAMV